MKIEGLVTLSNQAREKPALRPVSSGCDCLALRVQRRRPKGAMRFGRCKVALDVERALSRELSFAAGDLDAGFRS
jgi:hypothetical protein